jgi:hypothetical protein
LGMRNTSGWKWKDSDGEQIAAARDFLVAEGRRLSGGNTCIPPNPMEILGVFNRTYQERRSTHRCRG